MKLVKNLIASFVDFASSLQSIFLLLIRLAWGYLFLTSGLGKLQHINSIGDYFFSLGIPFPLFNAHLVAWVETIGGACLILGFATRLVSVPLIFTMVIAMLTAHADAVINLINDPSEFLKQSPITYLFAALVVFIFGPGKVSIDQIIESLTKSKGK